MKKTIFEKRYKINHNNYTQLSLDELREIERKTINTIYKNLKINEIIDAELVIIEEDLKNEIKVKQQDNNINDFYHYLNIIKTIKKIIENIEINTKTEREIKQIITILQLSLNIEPSFTTTIPENEKPLYDILDQYIERGRQLRKENSWKI